MPRPQKKSSGSPNAQRLQTKNDQQIDRNYEEIEDRDLSSNSSPCRGALVPLSIFTTRVGIYTDPKDKLAWAGAD